MGLATTYKFTCDRCKKVYNFDDVDGSDMKKCTRIKFSSVLGNCRCHPIEIEVCPECARRILFATVHGGEAQYNMIDSVINNALSVYDAWMEEKQG